MLILFSKGTILLARIWAFAIEECNCCDWSKMVLMFWYSSGRNHTQLEYGHLQLQNIICCNWSNRLSYNNMQLVGLAGMLINSAFEFEECNGRGWLQSLLNLFVFRRKANYNSFCSQKSFSCLGFWSWSCDCLTTISILRYGLDVQGSDRWCRFYYVKK